MRRTLNSAVNVTGIGLHGGQTVCMTLEPASAGQGIQFVRTDVAPDAAIIPARYDLVTDTQLCTRLSNAADTSIGTVEHVMAALAGTGITDVTVAVDAPEVPILDGSSAPFVAAILDAGFRELDAPVMAIRILKQVRFDDGDKWAQLSPASRFEMGFGIDFADPAIGVQTHQMAMVNGAFVGELSDCRTFGQLTEVDYLRSLGLARGGSLKNAIVVDKGRVLNPEGLRRPDEFVRHKMLDAVGDLALAGAPILGRYDGFKAGHGLTNKLLHRLFDTPDAWTFEMLQPGRAPGGRIRVPATVKSSEAVAV
ncbi:MAG: UDP-3-O-acyl-N-acetylglucosamine deacetylase [Pseudomonadota bacterium]